MRVAFRYRQKWLVENSEQLGGAVIRMNVFGSGRVVGIQGKIELQSFSNLMRRKKCTRKDVEEERCLNIFLFAWKMSDRVWCC